MGGVKEEACVVGLQTCGANMAAGGATVIPTGPLHGYQVVFSPYTSSKLAFAGANNYGIAGKGGV